MREEDNRGKTDQLLTNHDNSHPGEPQCLQFSRSFGIFNLG